MFSFVPGGSKLRCLWKCELRTADLYTEFSLLSLRLKYMAVDVSALPDTLIDSSMRVQAKCNMRCTATKLNALGSTYP